MGRLFESFTFDFPWDHCFPLKVWRFARKFATASDLSFSVAGGKASLVHTCFAQDINVWSFHPSDGDITEVKDLSSIGCIALENLCERFPSTLFPFSM